MANEEKSSSKWSFNTIKRCLAYTELVKIIKTYFFIEQSNGRIKISQAWNNGHTKDLMSWWNAHTNCIWNIETNEKNFKLKKITNKFCVVQLDFTIIFTILKHEIEKSLVYCLIYAPIEQFQMILSSCKNQTRYNMILHIRKRLQD